MNEQEVKAWIQRNPDIPVYSLRNGPCNRCGKMNWTENNLLHFCIVEPPRKV